MANVWQDYDSGEIERLGDGRQREVMRWVQTATDQLAAMDPQSSGEAMVSLLATVCNACPDPLATLDKMVATIRPRFVLMQSQTRGNG